MADQVKIEFRVEPDEDGYPPIGVERLWATPMPNGHYIVDNTPFYVSGISAEDEVSVVDVDGTLRFEALVRASGISTFRIVPSDLERIDEVRREIEALGGCCEVDRRAGLIAIEIGAELPIQPFLGYFVRGKETGAIDFEEGALRHALP